MASIPGMPIDYGTTWAKANYAAMQRADGICQRCGSKAEHVHHIIPIRLFEFPDDGNTEDNLIAVCIPCHREEHRLLRLAIPVNPLLSFRVEPAIMQEVERYWRYETKHRHLSDAARELLEAGLAVMAERRATPVPPPEATP